MVVVFLPYSFLGSQSDALPSILCLLGHLWAATFTWALQTSCSNTMSYLLLHLHQRHSLPSGWLLHHFLTMYQLFSWKRWMINILESSADSLASTSSGALVGILVVELPFFIWLLGFLIKEMFTTASSDSPSYLSWFILAFLQQILSLHMLEILWMCLQVDLSS